MLEVPDYPDEPEHEEAFERWTQIVVVGVRRATARTDVDAADKQRLRSWRYRAEKIERGESPWEGGSPPPTLPDTPITQPYRVPTVSLHADLVVRKADNRVLLRALGECGVHTTTEWQAATVWPEAINTARPLMDYTGPAHVAADILTGLLDGIPVQSPDGSWFLLTTFVAQEWVAYELTEEEQEEERKKGTLNARVEQLEDKAILGVLDLTSGAITYYQQADVYRFLTDGGWLPTLAAQCRARRNPIYQLNPEDWQLHLACHIGVDKHLQGAPHPGLSVAQQHRSYALYAAVHTLGRAAIQGEPGTGKSRMLTLLMAQMAYRWKERDGIFRGQKQPAWMRRLKKVWKANTRTHGDDPKALPFLVAMPLKTRKGFQRDCQAAWPAAEFMVINDHTDLTRWMARCAESDAPAVIAIASLSQTKDFGNEWVSAAIHKQTVCTVPNTDEALAAFADSWMVGGSVAGYHDRVTGELMTKQATHSTFFCPDCGLRVEDVPLGTKEDEETLEPVTSVTYFHLKRRWCRHCNASLNAKDRISERRAKWPHVPFAAWSQGVEWEPHAPRGDKRRKSDPLVRRITAADGSRGPVAPESHSPYDFLYRVYRGCVALTIIDEAHNLSGRDSHLARAGHLAMRAAQTRVMASGTHFAGTLDKLFHYWMRYNASFWRSLGLGWNDLSQAVARYGVVQHWVREVESTARKGGRGQTELRESTIPAPGVSAKLLPRLLSELVFLDVLDVGAHMPPREEIPELVPMSDPTLVEHTETLRSAIAEAEQHYTTIQAQVEKMAANVDVSDADIETMHAHVVEAEQRLHSAQEQQQDAETWRHDRDLASHYRAIEGKLEGVAKQREAGSSAARLAKGTVPRWFAALPCVAPPFTVQYSTKDDWGNITAKRTLLTTPVLAWEHVYPAERRIQEIVAGERGEGRRVMVYFEQQNRSMAERLTWLLAEHTPWTLPNSVKAEDREDAIRRAVQDGQQVVLVPFLRVAEGLNLQDVLDTIIWAELPKNLFVLDQASRRIWRLNKREHVRLYYIAYIGTAGHRKLRKLAAMNGAASLFAGNTPDGQLARSVGAHKTTLAQLSAGLDDEDVDMQAAFQRRNAEFAATLAKGRQWIGVTDTLPERLAALHARRPAPVFGSVLTAPTVPPVVPISVPTPVSVVVPMPTCPQQPRITFDDRAWLITAPRRAVRGRPSPVPTQPSLLDAPSAPQQLALFD